MRERTSRRRISRRRDEEPDEEVMLPGPGESSKPSRSFIRSKGRNIVPERLRGFEIRFKRQDDKSITTAKVRGFEVTLANFERSRFICHRTFDDRERTWCLSEMTTGLLIHMRRLGEPKYSQTRTLSEDEVNPLVIVDEGNIKLCTRLQWSVDRLNKLVEKRIERYGEINS